MSVFAFSLAHRLSGISTSFLLSLFLLLLSPVWAQAGDTSTFDIVYISDETGQPQIWTANSRDPAVRRQVSHFVEPGYQSLKPSWPRWSPDGQWIAFQANPGGGSEIFAMKSDGSELARQLTTTSGSNYAIKPDFGDKPDWVHYMKVVPRSHTDIYRVNISTKAVEPVSVNSGTNMQSFDVSDDAGLRVEMRENGCCWTPNQYTMLHVMENDQDTGESWQVIARDGHSEWHGRISPDNQKIVYMQATGAYAPHGLYEINENGTGKRTLIAPTSSNHFLPAWSPQGERLVIEKQVTGSRDLYFLDISTLEQREFISGSANYSQPDWLHTSDPVSIPLIQGANPWLSDLSDLIDAHELGRLEYFNPATETFEVDWEIGWDENTKTYILVHGWNGLMSIDSCADENLGWESSYKNLGEAHEWIVDMAKALADREREALEHPDGSPRIFAFNWTKFASSSICIGDGKYFVPNGQVDDQGSALAEYLFEMERTLADSGNRVGELHFLGHSLGGGVAAHAARDFLDSIASGQDGGGLSDGSVVRRITLFDVPENVNTALFVGGRVKLDTEIFEISQYERVLEIPIVENYIAAGNPITRDLFGYGKPYFNAANTDLLGFAHTSLFGFVTPMDWYRDTIETDEPTERNGDAYIRGFNESDSDNGSIFLLRDRYDKVWGNQSTHPWASAFDLQLKGTPDEWWLENSPLQVTAWFTLKETIDTVKRNWRNNSEVVKEMANSVYHHVKEGVVEIRDTSIEVIDQAADVVEDAGNFILRTFNPLMWRIQGYGQYEEGKGIDLTTASPSYAFANLQIPNDATEMVFEFLPELWSDSDTFFVAINDKIIYTLSGSFFKNELMNTGYLDSLRWAGEEVSLSIGVFSETFGNRITLTGFGFTKSGISVENQLPVANAGPNETLECTGKNTTVALDGSVSTDPDGDLLSFLWSGTFGTLTGSTPGIDLGIGVYPVDLIVNDGKGGVAGDRVVKTLQDTTSPVMIPPPHAAIECASANGTTIDLGVPTVSDVCDDGPTIMNDAPSVFLLGTTIVTWTATDASGNAVTAAQEVTVVDTIAPELSIEVLPDMLWPPNHKMRDIEAMLTVSDACDANPAVTLTALESNEPDNGQGDGNTVNDIQEADIGTDDRSFKLRAERSDKGDGRVYTTTYTATDSAGNTTNASATVTVPHDKGK